jgi:hypothetical protein
MNIGTLVDYAEHATKNREIIPKNAERWAREGVRVAMEAAMNKAERLFK